MLPLPIANTYTHNRATKYETDNVETLHATCTTSATSKLLCNENRKPRICQHKPTHGHRIYEMLQIKKSMHVHSYTILKAKVHAENTVKIHQ